MRKRLINLVCLMCGLLMLFEYFFNIPFFKTFAQAVRTWGVIIATFAIGLGGVNIVQVHSANIRKRQASFYSSVLLVSLIATIIIGLWLGIESDIYTFLFDSTVVAPGTTLYAMLAFYLGSASYRAFRARNAEAALLLFAAIIVMIGAVPIGEAISPHFSTVSEWLIDIPNTAGQRGIMICSALGFISISLRLLLGLDRGSAIDMGGVE